MANFTKNLFAQCVCVVFKSDLRSNHDYLRQLYDLCTHCEKNLLEPVNGRDQSFHPSSKLGALTEETK